MWAGIGAVKLSLTAALQREDEGVQGREKEREESVSKCGWKEEWGC